MAPAGVTDACCAPPAINRDRNNYTLKGTYKPYATFDKTYVTGDESSKSAIIFIYDIFGYWPTTQQGADILAERTGSWVIMPDFAHGNPYDSERYLSPPEGVNPGAEVGTRFFDPADIQARLDEVKAVAEQLRKDGKTSVGLHGLCWGGHLALTAGSWDNGLLSAVSTSHPAALSPEQGNALKVPAALFPSKDEDIKVAEGIYNDVKAKPFGKLSEYKYYGDMHHGWSGAHAWLDKEDNAEQYADVYHRLGNFYSAVATA